MASDNPKIRVDIVSDIVCPWCIIGYRQLDMAADQTGHAVDVHWHPFELNPDMAPDGENLRDHLAAKYGTTREGSIAARARLTDLGASLGFRFNYADDMRMYNTHKAHQLIHWARQAGQQTAHALKLALFEAFFTHRRDVSDTDVLCDVADTVGLSRTEAAAVLKTAQFSDSVRTEIRDWQARGIQGVPALVFDNRYLLSGAQGEETFARVLDRVAAEIAETRTALSPRMA